MTLLRILESVFLVAMTALVCVLSCLAIAEKPKIDKLLGAASTTISDADTAVKNVNSTVSMIRGATREQELATRGYIKRTNRLLDQSAEAVQQVKKDGTSLQIAIESFNELVKNTDSSFNGRVAPQVASDLEGLHGMERKLNATIAASQTTVENFGAASKKLPAVMDNAVRITANSAQTTANISATTGDIHRWVHRETTPARGTWNFIKMLLGPLAHVAEIARVL